ncbi:MAG: succinylglutamate desuccinylase/aspartoacylase family protein [Bacteroidota bacterium]
MVKSHKVSSPENSQEHTQSSTTRSRIIGSYEGEKQGALLIVTTTLHGNEPAGSLAVNTVLRLLKEEKGKNAGFIFTGKIVGLIGNLAAQSKNKRYIDTDMNRLWRSERIKAIENETDERKLLAEEREVRELLNAIRGEIASYQPTVLYILDLHTTTAEGGIFTIVPDGNKASLAIGLTLFAPVITGFSELLKGTLTNYFNGDFEGIECTPLTFESGQHHAEKSVTNAVSAIINTLRTIRCVNAADVEDKHDTLLRAHAASLPRQARLLYRHPVEPVDRFVMRPGYQNFQRVTAKEILAEDRKGVIRAQKDSLIIMPLYQAQGNDGFFLIEEVV